MLVCWVLHTVIQDDFTFGVMDAIHWTLTQTTHLLFNSIENYRVKKANNKRHNYLCPGSRHITYERLQVYDRLKADVISHLILPYKIPWVDVRQDLIWRINMISRNIRVTLTVICHRNGRLGFFNPIGTLDCYKQVAKNTVLVVYGLYLIKKNSHLRMADPATA